MKGVTFADEVKKESSKKEADEEDIDEEEDDLIFKVPSWRKKVIPIPEETKEEEIKEADDDQVKKATDGVGGVGVPPLLIPGS